MEAMIIPELSELIAFFSSEVLKDCNAPSLREGKQFSLVVRVN
jgi:hypothetical protein